MAREPEPQPPRAPGAVRVQRGGHNVEQILGAARLPHTANRADEYRLPGSRSAADEAEFVRMGPSARLLREREPDQPTQSRIVAEVAEHFRRFETDAGMRVPASVYCVTATRPGPRARPHSQGRHKTKNLGFEG